MTWECVVPDKGPKLAEEERLRARQVVFAADKRRRLRVA
jgi:hypothetical protein